jgi:hypothetical protein
MIPLRENNCDRDYSFIKSYIRMESRRSEYLSFSSELIASTGRQRRRIIETGILAVIDRGWPQLV